MTKKETRARQIGQPQGETKPTLPPEPSGAALDAPPKTGRTPGGFAIVGIGASAGGLAAFESFFSGMPAGTEPGMAFVLVQHLAPDHKSILSDLIRRYTRLQVFEVEDGMEVQLNCAYIIPPNRDMAFLNGTLQLLEPVAPRGQRLPIDFFFRSLAQDQRERAIGVVLSGTGSDGTLGIRAIKGEGGMVMVQSPATTEYDGMPRSAIGTGLMDYELPPAEMVPQLIAYVTHAFGNPPRPAVPAPKAESAFKKIFVLLRAQTGHDFSQYKPSTIQRRIERRMAVHQVETMEDYVKFVQQTPAEVDALFRDMLIGVTSFFRDPEAFKALAEQVIPNLFAGKRADAAIRVWAPGCSTGEEAYSLAILLAERQQALKQSFKIQVFATDIDSHAIASARAGIYPASSAADLTPERLARFFSTEPGDSVLRIHKSIRDMLVFSEQNVIKDPPFSKLDLISCRNLLIYLDGELQKKLIPLFHYALNPGGYLFLGTSEAVSEFGDLFATLERKQKIYQRKDAFHGAQRAGVGRSLPPMTAVDATLQRIVEKPGYPRKLPLRELTEQALLQQVVQAGALVNAQGDILYLHGRTGLYLEPAPGASGANNILKMAREGLLPDLTTALHKAALANETVCCPGLRVKTNGDFTTVNLLVRPMAAAPSPSLDPPLFLVILEQAPVGSQRPEVAGGASEAGRLKSEAGEAMGADARVAELRRELQAKEEYLQSANEELETSNEELKSANEEMQSVNEELQSTNEELETSKEELQSVNEELATVNAELQTKVVDLSRANNDMNNLLAGTGIATVFVDVRLCVLRFTPAATKIINLIQSDIGRPVGHIVSNLSGYGRLTADMQDVLDTLIPKELDVRSAEGRWYTMRILPYRTMDNVIEGVVLTFVDVTAARTLQEELQESEAQYRALFENHAAVKLIINPDTGVIIDANPAAARFYGWSRDVLRKMRIQDINVLLPQDVEREIQAATQEQRSYFEFRHRLADGTVRDVAVFSSNVATPGRAARLHSVVHDITARKRAEEALRRNEKDLKESQRIAHVGSWRLDVAANQVVWTEELYNMYGFDPSLPPPPYTEHMKLFTPESWERLSKALARTRETGIPYTLELQTIRKDGSNGWLWVRGEADIDSTGKTVGLWGVAQDITERKLAEETLRENELKFRTLVEVSSAGIWKTDASGRTTYVSPRWCELAGIAEAAAAGQGWASALHPDDRIPVQTGWEAAAAAETPYAAEFRFVHPDGRLVWVDCQAASVRVGGRITEWIGTVTDITARKEAEAARREIEQKYRTLYESSPDAHIVWAIAPDGRDQGFVDCNPAALDLLGMTREQLLAADAVRLSPERQPDGRLSRDKSGELIARCLTKGSLRFDWMYLRADGEPLPVEITMTVYQEQGQFFLHSVWRDLTGLTRTAPSTDQAAASKQEGIKT